MFASAEDEAESFSGNKSMHLPRRCNAMMGKFSSRSISTRVGDDSGSVELPTVKEDGTGMKNMCQANEKAARSMKSRVLRRVFSENYKGRKSGDVWDPRGQKYRRWSKVFLGACLVSLFVDPLFFFIPQTETSDQVCLEDGLTAKIVLTVIRSLIDTFYITHIVVRFKTAYVAPFSRVSGRGELVTNRKKIALRYLSHKAFWMDLWAALPIPQFITWAMIPNLDGSATSDMKTALWFLVIFQYIPRAFLMLPLRSQLIDANGGMTESAWAAAVYNVLLFFVASHVSGSCFYLLIIARQDACWRAACNLESPFCKYTYLDCRSLGDPGRASWSSITNITTKCAPTGNFYHFGIYAAPTIYSLGSCSFFSKYFYCYWWGLNNLSCFGQNLAQVTSIYLGEILFELCVCNLGLVLFALLIGNMTRYLQSTTKRLDEWRLQWRDTEQWMHHRHLPPNLKQSVRTYEQFKWVATRGVNEESLLRNLPPDLRRNIKRYLSLELVRRVPLFNQMDDRMLDAICERLKPVLFTEKMLLMREGDPVKEMVFLIRGHLDSWTTGGGRSGFFNSVRLSPGDFCGEELLTWALDPRTSIVLPSSTRTVKAVKDVEAFALAADELKFVASQYRRLHSKELRHKFRFYSHQWRMWAACFIQVAWRRHKKLKELGKLRACEENSARPGTLTISPRSFWDIYAQQLLENCESTRRDEGKQAEGTLASDDEMKSSMEKPQDLDFLAD